MVIEAVAVLVVVVGVSAILRRPGGVYNVYMYRHTRVDPVNSGGELGIYFIFCFRFFFPSVSARSQTLGNFPSYTNYIHDFNPSSSSSVLKCLYTRVGRIYIVLYIYIRPVTIVPYYYFCQHEGIDWKRSIIECVLYVSRVRAYSIDIRL